MTGEAPAAEARVAVLPEALANQIAAGEVVERPASVVKELLDNAIDAQAGRIFVEVEGGGAVRIQVLDDGLGMPPEDARLAVQRHATSKLRAARDLATISTLGFRGEALPSIASVSRFRLVTRTAEAAVATQLTIEGGAPPVVTDAGAPEGTRVEVRDLFYNVPARLKFLKRPATELGHVTQLVTACALGYPYIHVRLKVDGRVSLDHPPAKTLAQRIFQVLGRKIATHTFEVRGDGEVRVRGFLSDPATHRHNAAQLHTFINGRYVKDRVVTHAINQAYAGLLDRGRSPLGVLYVHVPPTAVDVNVHPTKAEVRFVNAGRVHQAIATAVGAMLASSPWLRLGDAALYAARPKAPRATEPPAPVPAPARPEAASEERASASRLAQPGAFAPSPSANEDDKGGAAPHPPPAASAPRELEFSASPPRSLLDGAPLGAPPAAPLAAPLAAPSPPPSASPAPGTPARSTFFRDLRLLGSTRRGFLVCEGARGLVLVDGGAARARLLEHELRQALAAAGIPSRDLLFPVQLEPPRAHGDALRAHGALLSRLGLRVEPFGGGTWQLTAVPAPLAQASPGRLLAAALEALAAPARPAPGRSPTQPPSRGLEDAALTAMTRAAVSPGGAAPEPLDDAEARALLKRLDQLPAAPGRRPPLARLPWSELTRRLERS